MKVYIHECADETTHLLSYEGQVLGVYSSIDDAQDNCRDYTVCDEEIYYQPDMPVLDSAA